jgi:hypothetical protein
MVNLFKFFNLYFGMLRYKIEFTVGCIYNYETFLAYLAQNKALPNCNNWT